MRGVFTLSLVFVLVFVVLAYLFIELVIAPAECFLA